MKEKEEAAIRRMQENLAVIRKVGGWTTAQFGEEIGVTRQTVSNLEKGRTPLTKTQYLAIRAVLIHEIGSKGNEGLAQVVRALVDEPLEDPVDAVSTDESPRPSENAMEDMALLTQVLTTTLASNSAVSVLAERLAMQTVPAVIYAISRFTKDK